MKKIICLSAVSALLAALTIGVGAANEEQIVLNTSEESVAVGETFTVTITAGNIGDFNTAMFYDVGYDAEYLEWVGGEWLLAGATLEDYIMESKKAGNVEQGRSGVFYTEEMISGDTTALATMEFKVLKKSDEPKTVRCSVILKKNNMLAIDTAEVQTEVDISGEPEIDKFEFAGTTMTLGNSLSLDFAFDISKINGDGHYAVMTKQYADGREPVTMTSAQEDWKRIQGNLYYTSFTGVAAKEMCDTVEIVIYNSNGQAVTNPYSDSIYNYASRMLGKTTDPLLLAVYVDMLNYGAGAQVQFKYDTENLANRSLTEEQKNYATASVEIKDSREKGTGYFGTALTLESQILLDFVFEDRVIGTDYDGMYAIAAYTDHYNHKKEIRIDGSDFKKYPGQPLHYISVSEMAVADCSELVTCTVYDAAGNAIAWATDSVESYAARNQEKLYDIVMPIMKFGTSSYKYFHAKG